jgi:hypothetical protein
MRQANPTLLHHSEDLSNMVIPVPAVELDMFWRGRGVIDAIMNAQLPMFNNLRWLTSKRVFVGSKARKGKFGRDLIASELVRAVEILHLIVAYAIVDLPSTVKRTDGSWMDNTRK